MATVRAHLGLFFLVMLAGCGDVADLATTSRTTSPASATSAADARPGNSTLDAGSVPLTNQPPRCSVAVSGAVTKSWSNSQTTASFAMDDQGGVGTLDLGCTFDDGDITYAFAPTFYSVTGVGTFDAYYVYLTRVCNVDSCPGAWSFFAGDGDGQTTCTLVIDRFAPATRGGMSAQFTCASLVIADPDDVHDAATVSISGSIELPGVAPGAPPLTLDAGYAVSPFETSDAGLMACTMSVSGEYVATSMKGVGRVVQSGASVDGGVSLHCAASANGVGYELDDYDEGTDSSAGFLTVSGASWCAAGCSLAYGTNTLCDMNVTLDEGVGGRFRGSATCGPMFVGLGDAGATAAVSVAASLDTTISAPPRRSDG